MTDQYYWWREALLGNALENERGKPRAGFWRAPKNEAIAIWWESDEPCCERQRFDASHMDADQIDELFGAASRYPVEEEVYRAVAERGEPWPEHYLSRLTLAECQANAIWTPELGRKKLGATTLLAENERAVVGDNSSKAEPHELLVSKINDLADTRRAWLREIGGTVTTQDHADKAADFAEAFGKLEKEATEAHKQEKQPFLEGGRAVDQKWKPIGTLAETAKRDSKAMLTPYLRAQDEARRQAAQKAAQEAHQRQEAAPAPVEPVKARAGHSGRGVSLRTVTRPVVTDLPAVAAFLAGMSSPPPDFAELCRTTAGKLIRDGVQVPGARLDTHQEAA